MANGDDQRPEKSIKYSFSKSSDKKKIIFNYLEESGAISHDQCASLSPAELMGCRNTIRIKLIGIILILN